MNLDIIKVIEKKLFSKTGTEQYHVNDYDGNELPLIDQLAIVTHYLHHRNDSDVAPYYTLSSQIISNWEKSFQHSTAPISRMGCLEDTGMPIVLDLFGEIETPFPSPENYKFTFIDLFAGIGGFRLAVAIPLSRTAQK